MAISKSSRLILILLLLAGAGVAFYIVYGGGAKVPHRETDPDSMPAAATKNHQVAASTSRPAGTAPAAARGSAKDAFDRGTALLNESKLIAARDALNEAYFSGELSPELEDQARKKLEELADRTIFAATWLDGDPYSDRYIIQRGDNLQKIEQSQRLHVPAELIAKINSLDPSRLPEAKAIKVIRGPFHAVVYKSKFAMDVYLQRDNSPKVFVRRLPVGLGKNGSTPVGMWHVRLGRPAKPASASEPAQPAVSGKLKRARFDPPANCEIDHPIMYGESGYPFGEKGLFIPLEGDDDNTRPMISYGIHSTNEPASIGKEGSLGCVRLKDDDIDLVFNLLYEKWSTVEARP